MYPKLKVMPATLTPPKTAKRKPAVSQGLKRVDTSKKTTATKKKTTPKKKKTLGEIALELEKKPLIRVLDEDLVYGTNMMTKLMKEEKL